MDWPMRRKERAMSLKNAEELLEKALVGRLGASWRGEPYVVPLNFVYCEGKIYFHCAKKGRKLEYLSKNPRVCFEVDEFIGVKEGEETCSFDVYYRSVITFGDARIIETTDEKAEALKKLLDKYAKKRVEPVFDQDELERVEVVEILVKRITGKKNPP